MSVEAKITRQLEPAPGLLLQILEVRAFWEHCAALLMRPVWRISARGDGHPVLVLPGLAAGDATTALMRRFLNSRGFAPVATSVCATGSWSVPTTRSANCIVSTNARSASSAGASAASTRANSRNSRRNWCGLSFPLVRPSHRPSARDERLAPLRVRQRPSHRLARFPRASTLDPARSDDLDLEPDRRSRVVAVQRRDPTRDGGEHRRPVEPPRPRRASCGALRDRRPSRPPGRPLGAVPSQGLAASRLCGSARKAHAARFAGATRPARLSSVKWGRGSGRPAGSVL